MENIQTDNEQMGVSCANCIYVHEKKKLEGGGFECRFEPPQVVAIHQAQGVQLISMFPPVNETMGCSMFEGDNELPDNVIRIGH